MLVLAKLGVQKNDLESHFSISSPAPGYEKLRLGVRLGLIVQVFW